MEARIDKSGLLSLNRCGIFRPVYCPENGKFWCGDWCARFVEESHTFPGYTPDENKPEASFPDMEVRAINLGCCLQPEWHYITQDFRNYTVDSYYKGPIPPLVLIKDLSEQDPEK